MLYSTDFPVPGQSGPLSSVAHDLVVATATEAARADWTDVARAHWHTASVAALAALTSIKRAELGIITSVMEDAA